MNRATEFYRDGGSTGHCVLSAGPGGRIFEAVSHGANTALAAAVGSLTYLSNIGVDRIMQHRQPMMRRLQEELPRHGFIPLTPPETPGPIASFSYRDAAARLDARLGASKVKVELGSDLVRISPSVYNDMDDVDQVVRALSS